jgi:hypothetical protein
MTKRKIIRFQGRRDKIMCECGTEISLLPDAKAMGEAIEVHIALHMNGGNGPGCTIVQADQLRNDLIIQVLRITGESEDEGSHE